LVAVVRQDLKEAKINPAAKAMLSGRVKDFLRLAIPLSGVQFLPMLMHEYVTLNLARCTT
jgi:hypothetical protein